MLSGMAILKTAALLLLIVYCISTYENVHAAEDLNLNASKIDCKGRCMYRCSKASRAKMCVRACNTCCVRCNCVPPGTSGNTHLCPCYASMTTHGGCLKCP
ncbi:PREDICTED: gibberellin-regulated protein 2 [Tarenaya hassleriana]|uniref:gibberellin-regulated protein 2 n=1 Tax=Tarenaya hassleriana TaxID=28532 RepID=UPI00053C685F|nr:PREDICTED: gibberellin-regulated protein 2 [Tarenaya hassleriana]